MIIEQFQTTLHPQPFRPFSNHRPAGRAFEVAHPDFVACSPPGRTAIVCQGEERHSVLDLLLMSEIEIRTNGRAIQ